MHCFYRRVDDLVANFENNELELVRSLLAQLIELLVDQQPSVPAPGVGYQSQDDDDIFARLERELATGPDPDDLDDVDSWRADPVVARLFPPAYPDDARANAGFWRYTQSALLDDKVSCAQAMLTDLEHHDAAGRCPIPAKHLDAWFKSLTNLRLALAVRLGIQSAEDADRFAELPDDNPQCWVYGIYEWLGWVQESLLTVAYGD